MRSMMMIIVFSLLRVIPCLACCPLPSFFQVDNHIHLSGGLNARTLLRYIKDKILNHSNDIVENARPGVPAKTLGEWVVVVVGGPVVAVLVYSNAVMSSCALLTDIFFPSSGRGGDGRALHR